MRGPRPRDELEGKLERSWRAGTPLTVKVGFDPTAPDIHLGHTVLLRKMRQFQDLGHRVVFLIGDFTGLIGDPTGRSKTRPPLTREQIARKRRDLQAPVLQGLGPGPDGDPLQQRMAVAAGLRGVHSARRDVQRRADARAQGLQGAVPKGQPISLHEFLYPLAQAYDSVFLKADVEMGGTDQLFNLNVGRDIMPDYGLAPQVVMTMPLLEGLDGVEKMSKILGNYVGVDEPAG